MSKYELSNSNIRSRVVSHLALDTSGGYDVSGVDQLMEGKSRPLCSLHRHEVTRCSTVDYQIHAGVKRVVATCANAPSNREQSRMFRFGSFGVDTPKCRILFWFVCTDCGVQLVSRTSAMRSSKMLSRPTWAVLCSWSVMEIVPYCLYSDIFEACLILTLDVPFLEMVVNSSDSRGPSVHARHSCSNTEFLDYPGD